MFQTHPRLAAKIPATKKPATPRAAPNCWITYSGRSRSEALITPA